LVWVLDAEVRSPKVGRLKPPGPLATRMNTRDLSAHTVYRAGRGIEEVARELGLDPEEMVKLASNENMFGPSPLAVEAIRDSAERMHTYPKASHADLVEELAERWDADTEQVWLGNGGDGALDCLARAMLAPGDEVLVPSPGFAYYAMSARYHHGEVRRFPTTTTSNVAWRRRRGRGSTSPRTSTRRRGRAPGTSSSPRSATPRP